MPRKEVNKFGFGPFLTMVPLFSYVIYFILNVTDDHSRVILKRDDPKATTYINACYIDVSCDTRLINKAMSRKLVKCYI